MSVNVHILQTKEMWKQTNCVDQPVYFVLTDGDF
jgi:hypothetical protein